MGWRDLVLALFDARADRQPLDKLLRHLSPDQRLVLALLFAGVAVAAARAFYELVELRLGRAFGRLLRRPRETLLPAIGPADVGR